MAKKLLQQLLAGIIIGILIFVGFQLFAQPYAYQGSLIDPPLPAKNFSLNQADDTTFQLSEQKGKLVLLYFGYTFCPDVCPTTLRDLAKAKERLGDEASEIEVVMITVDPERDTSIILDGYVKVFDPDFVGLSGTLEELEIIWGNFGVFREKKDSTSAAGYLVDHTARVYVVNANGELQLTFPYGMDAEAMADDLAHLLKR
ncbi:MAG: SCO family protein [Chloroflexi bacterium]|nr:SCO family protein [Chloroflexota bacterium]